MKFLTHMIENPFIAATGTAALVHSTWSLGTLFSGVQPEAFSIHLVGWLVPALLIAFSLDIGQIATSWEIREGGLTVPRAVTFLVFAGATYYLQWLYIAHHMPALPLGAGISDVARATTVSLRDAALWLIPALLPLSTVLYTFSGNRAPAVVTIDAIQSGQGTAVTVGAVAVAMVEAGAGEGAPLPQLPAAYAVHQDAASGEGWVATCDCGWVKKGLSDAGKAGLALGMHQSKHCAKRAKLEVIVGQETVKEGDLNHA